MTAATQDVARMGSFDQTDEGLVRYLGLDPRKPEDRAAVAVCRHYGFDPLLKHVVVIPRSGVYITRDGMLNVAHRSGQLDGIVVEEDPHLSDDGKEWVARVSVYRKDMSRPFTFPGRYAANGSNKLYAPEMALKAAEAHALRRAFDIGGLPTLEEQRPDDTAPMASTAVTADEILTPRVDAALNRARAKQAEPQPADEPFDSLGRTPEQAAADDDAEPVGRSDEAAELWASEADSEA